MQQFGLPNPAKAVLHCQTAPYENIAQETPLALRNNNNLLQKRKCVQLVSLELAQLAQQVESVTIEKIHILGLHHSGAGHMRQHYGRQQQWRSLKCRNGSIR